MIDHDPTYREEPQPSDVQALDAYLSGADPDELPIDYVSGGSDADEEESEQSD